MATDNTPTVTARRRKPTPHMRLRLETAKRLQILGRRAKTKRNLVRSVKPGETDPEKMVAIAPRLPRLKKNTILTPPKPPARFRKRQVQKTWLPTHLFHAKRAHMTSPTEPLWRFAVPLTPTEKSYRPTHRASLMRGCVVWDMSYMATIGLEGKETSLIGLLKAMGVKEEWSQGSRAKKWLSGTRSWGGWLFETHNEKRAIAPVSLVWRAEGPEPDPEIVPQGQEHNSTPGKAKRRILIRVHPAAFLQVWDEILNVSKIQRPPLMVEDLRFEIGSIEVTGPGSTEALLGALKPVPIDGNGALPPDSPESTWSKVANITNPAALPPNALLGFDVTDPRLHHPPRTVGKPCSDLPDSLLELLASWPPDRTQTSPSLFDRTARLTASRCLPSQKVINRRKAAALPGAHAAPLPDDPKIPVILMSSRPPGIKHGPGVWTLLLPWKCVLPAWYSLMYYPVSSGGNPRFAGLRELRQVAFEQGVPWFPGDYPGTKAGWDWECMEREKRRVEWEKRPKGRRTEWESLDLGKKRKGEVGLGWACDWTRLLMGPPDHPAVDESHVETLESNDAMPVDTNNAEKPPSKPKAAVAKVEASPGIYHLQSSSAILMLNYSISTIPEQFRTLDLAKALATIKITLLSRGTPTSCARIYRLPTNDPALRAQWLSLSNPIRNPKSAKQKLPRFPTLPKDASIELRRQHLASALLAPLPADTQRKSGNSLAPQAGDDDYPVVPDEEDLIGFVTTGNFNLGEGRSTGVGCLVLGKVLEGKGRERALCIVREAGQGIGRLGRWEIV